MRIAFRFALIAVTAAAVACGGSPTTTSNPTPLSALPHQTKGYELYSWQSGGNWNYALITGTDRLKTVDEVTTAPDSAWAAGLVKVSAQDIAGLQSQLRRLPQGESVSWIGRQTRAQWQAPADPFDLPPAAIVDAVNVFCRQIGVNLQVLP